ncbi:SDR family NAD(P)-dependent oxidoreductase [Mycobacterium sp. 050134]|uniref:SDR family NAD(P)-dependent oxidoreductase n=1 Tax=Mycobacterium sp. 050134 TaxID=3096111 RepID=UPI002ED95C7B
MALIGKLHGRTALVTGSTKGVGAAIARRFAGAGARVVISGRNRDRGVALERGIRASGGEAHFVAIDLNKEEQVAAGVQAAVECYGGLDILVNNAAPTDVVLGGDGSVAELSTERLMSILRPGLVGQFWCCAYALPHLIANRSSAIVNISAAASKIGVPKATGYSLSKGAINALSRQIAVDYGDRGLRSNTIVIGHVLTDDAEALLKEHPEMSAAFDAMTVTRPGYPDDVAAAAQFLASDDAGYITGVELPVDGGMLIVHNVPAVSQATKPDGPP